MGGSAVLELSEGVTFYLVGQLLKGCATGSTRLLLYHEPNLDQGDADPLSFRIRGTVLLTHDSFTLSFELLE